MLGPHLRATLIGSWLLTALSIAAAPDTADRLRNSVQHMQRGDLAAAEAEASLALGDPRSKPVAQALLGSIRMQQKRFEEGKDLLERAVAADPNLVGARLNLAQAHALLGNEDQAESIYRTVLALEPGNVNARMALARTESSQGNYRQALEIADPVEPQLRASPDGLMALAEAHAGLGNGQALRSLVSDWEGLRGAPRAWTVRFALLVSRGGLNRAAIRLLEQLKREGLVSFDVAFNLAGFYLLENDLAKASANYELAVEFNDESVPALRQVARIAERQGEFEKALSFLIRAKLEAPEDPDVQLSFGMVALRLEFIEDATSALEKALEVRPGHRTTRYWLGTARGAARQYDESLELYRGLLAERPDDAQLHYAVGSVYYLKVAFEDAARHLAESCKLDPGQVLSPYYLAMIAQKQGRNETAAGMFREILEDHPDHGLSYEGLAVSLFKQRQYEPARANFRKALALNPDSARTRYQLGQLLIRMGLREEAKRQLALAKGLREEEENNQLVRTLLNPH